MKVVSRPKVQRIVLGEWDPSGETWVDLREPRFAETAQRQTYWSQYQVVGGPSVERAVYQQTEAELAAIEIYLTFAGSNILREGPDGEPMPAFPDGPLAWQDFVQTLNALPDDLVLEWHRHVLTLKPEWELT